MSTFDNAKQASSDEVVPFMLSSVAQIINCNALKHTISRARTFQLMPAECACYVSSTNVHDHF